MQFRCILMRHGEALSHHPEGDFGRGLSESGKKQAASTGKQLVASGWEPTQCFCSSATRALETMEEVARIWPSPLSWTAQQSLYLADWRQIMRNARDVSLEHSCILWVGHNPGWSHAVRHWTGESALLDVANAALLSLDADVESWVEAFEMSGLWRLHHVFLPREE